MQREGKIASGICMSVHLGCLIVRSSFIHSKQVALSPTKLIAPIVHEQQAKKARAKSERKSRQISFQTIQAKPQRKQLRLEVPSKFKLFWFARHVSCILTSAGKSDDLWP